VDFSELLRRERLRRGLDQAGLARRSGTTQTYISRIERGAVSPSARTMQRLLHSMGLELVLDARPLTPGNASTRDLRADFLHLSPAERVEQAMELSDFLGDVAQRRP
jgi:transcriptional regulator with XRE-family HTH domain